MQRSFAWGDKAESKPDVTLYNELPRFPTVTPTLLAVGASEFVTPDV